MTIQPQTEGPPPVNEHLERLLALVRAGRSDDLEAAWMEAVESADLTLDDLLTVLAEVVSRNDLKWLESLAWLLLSSLSEARGTGAALDAAWQMKGMLPDSKVLREEIAGLYRAEHAAAPGIETLVEMTILRADVPLRDAPDLLEKFLRLPPGTYVSDPRRKSPGRVTGVDASRKVLAVSFGESDRAYDAGSVEALEALPADDFRAMAVFDRPGLEAIAREDPSRLFRMVLKAHGPRLGFRDMKARLADVAAPSDGWSRWWADAKKAVMRDPLVEMSDGTQPDFFLRSRPMTYEDEIRDRFDAAPSVEEKLLAALAYLGEAGHSPEAEAAVLGSFAAALAATAAPDSDAAPAEALGALAVHAEIRRHLGPAAPPAPPVPAPLTQAADLAAALAAIGSAEVAARALGFVRETTPDAWPDIYASAMPGCSQETCDRIAEALAAAGRHDLLAQAAETVLRQPNESVAAMGWLWKTAGAGRYPEALGGLDRALVTVRYFQAANEFALALTVEKARKMEILAQVRRTLSAKDFATLRDILDSTDAGWAREIRAAVSRNSGLTDHLRIQILEVLGRAHPVPIARRLPPWEEDFVYTTAAALEEKRKEFEKILNVKLPANSTAIGEAAARGDLSENAEFTAALEERDRLTERANAIQADLAKAKPIPAMMARSDTANIGTTVRARRLSTGAEETLTFLGPWDADTEKCIYYYKAPMALAFMGKAVGETAVLLADSGEEHWEVLEVRPAV